MARYKNVLKKYGITEEELKTKGIEIIAPSLGKIADVYVMLAVTELLCNGDIEEEEENNG